MLLPVLLLTAAATATANFDLYLKKPEVNRTLGLDAELYYVREGILNDYALTYRVVVAADIHSLYFTWKATAHKPVLYNMGVFVNETEGSGGGSGGTSTLAAPTLNVSLSGSIPISESTFRMDLPCSGLTSAEVTVVLNINVTAPRPRLPPTEVYIVRRKVCLQGQSGESSLQQLSSVEEEPTEEEHLPPVYYVISVLAALTLVLGIVFIVAALRNRMKKNNRHHVIISTSDLGMNGKEFVRSGESGSLLQQPNHPSNKYIANISVAGKAPSYASHQCVRSGESGSLLQQPDHSSNKYSADISVPGTSPSYASVPGTATSYTSLTPRSVYSLASSVPASYTASTARWPHGNPTIERKVTPETSRGRSQGSSSRATTRSSGSISKSELLLDPSTALLKNKFTHCEVECERVRVSALIQEGGYGRVYRGCIQNNPPENDQHVIIKSLSSEAPHGEVSALCTEGVQLLNMHHRNILALVGISFAENSQPLLIYPQHGCQNLKMYLQNHRSGHLVAGELLELAVQGAHALAFLHHSNMLHGDIAARNCMISDSFQLLLCDAALSRNLFPEDYEAAPSGTSRPIKWMASEAITDHIISTATDMWSYGVLLWELTTLAQQPYIEITACEMEDYLRDGYRLVQPSNCPDDVYKLMAFCWAVHPSDRPHVNLVLDYLGDFSKQLNNFV